ncbi:MAG: hypothetical protein Q7V14_04445 [Coriobacteriia bacterium]|nr:hypothetical protein [Coriobacteriia bacterium]
MQANTAVIKELAEAFGRGGYVRYQNRGRVARDGRTGYKKGYEVRFSVRSEDELSHLRKLLVAAGFKPGSPYSQGSRYRQPLYGRAQVGKFLQAIGDSKGQASNPCVNQTAPCAVDSVSERV